MSSPAGEGYDFEVQPFVQRKAFRRCLAQAAPATGATAGALFFSGLTEQHSHFKPFRPASESG